MLKKWSFWNLSTDQFSCIILNTHLSKCDDDDDQNSSSSSSNNNNSGSADTVIIIVGVHPVYLTNAKQCQLADDPQTNNLSHESAV